MTGRHTRALRRRPLVLSSGLALITALTIGTAFPAFAAESCALDAGTSTLTVTIGNGTTDAVLSSDTESGVAVANVDNCSGPFLPVTSIVVATEFLGDDTDETVTFNDPDGNLGGGGTASWSGITISVNLGDESDDTVVLEGTSDDDSFDTTFVTTPTGVEHFVLNGGDGMDTLTGGSTEDTLNGGNGDDTLTGGADDDDIYGGADADTINGGDGDDHLDGEDGSDVINGDAGDDYIHGGDDVADDVLHGGTGDDVFDECGGTGETGADDIFGDDGRDTVDYSDRTASLTITLDSGTDGDGESGEDDDIVTVEDVLGGSGVDVITGNAGDNYLSGGSGDDDLFGLSGNDVLEGGPGADDMDGGDLTDTLSYEHSDAPVYVDLQTPATNDGGSNYTSEANGDTFPAVENLVGSGYDDVLIGNGSTNVISGEGGNDDLSGGGGNDVLEGEGGVDDLYGGDGNDLLSGGDGGDSLYGENNADTLRGGSGVDWMDGGAGNDSLFGDAGSENTSGNWLCGGGTDKANLDKTDLFTKSGAQSALIGGTSACERLAGSFAR